LKIEVLRAVSSVNDSIAGENLQNVQKKGILVLNIMSSPGAGKTSLLLGTINKLHNKLRLSVIEGDIASDVDAKKIYKTGIPVVQINTGGNCSLEAHMIRSALCKLNLDNLDIIFIENVGNLICPAENNLGESKKIVIASLPEGDDKPQKYPVIFSRADAIIISKMDLLPYMDFKLNSFRRVVRGLNPNVKFFQISSRTGLGMDTWCKWLLSEAKKART
jgi:hydrogenase nickel incorporation protein HypB